MGTRPGAIPRRIGREPPKNANIDNSTKNPALNNSANSTAAALRPLSLSLSLPLPLSLSLPLPLISELTIAQLPANVSNAPRARV